MKKEEIKAFLEKCKLNPKEKLTTDDSYWRLDQLIRHAFEIEEYANQKEVRTISDDEIRNMESPYDNELQTRAYRRGLFDMKDKLAQQPKQVICRCLECGKKIDNPYCLDCVISANS